MLCIGMRKDIQFTASVPPENRASVHLLTSWPHNLLQDRLKQTEARHEVAVTHT